MVQQLDLHAPPRKVHAGVILMGGETEILDVAPIDLLNALTAKWNDVLPTEMVPDAARKEIMDIEFHWVNESGKPADLTAGIKMMPTVSYHKSLDTVDACNRIFHLPIS